MLLVPRRLFSLTAGTLLALACGAPAMADDTEIFVNNSLANEVRPNILFIMDTSGSMDENDVSLSKNFYSASTTYTGSCSRDRVYFSRGTAAIPPCSTANWVNKTAVKCAAALAGMSGVAGFWTGRTGQWNPDFTAWKDLRANAVDDVVECYADAGIDGIDATSTEKYARNGDAAHKWTSVQNTQLDWGAIGAHTLYSGNYLNWKYSTGTPVQAKRISVVQRALTELASSVDDVNIGLMRFSDNCNQSSSCSAEATAEGGMILKKVDDIRTSRAALIAKANLQAPGGNTPLSETMYEAGQYWAGKAVDYGLNSMGREYDPTASTPTRKSQPSDSGSRRTANQALYESPIKYQCQKNFNILLTDGLPTQDTSANNKIKILTDARNRSFATLTSNTACTGTGAGACLDDMTAYLAKADLVQLSNDDVQEQHVFTYTIGFGQDVPDGSQFLEDAADRGGTGTVGVPGDSFNAQNLEDLVDTLRRIVTKISDSGGTFATPTVSPNLFNGNQTLNDLYLTVFSASETEHWPGNLKKYRLKNGALVDASNMAALGPDGFFKDTAQSVWSAAPDGQKVESGGAANLIPQPRKVYTHFSGTNLDDANNLLNAANPNLTDALLGTGSPIPTKQQLIDWVHDLDTTTTPNTSRHVMGDPLHSHPAVVTYGGSAATPNAYDTVVFVATNDGYLHAITGSTGVNSTTRDSVGGGTELWSFVPQELLGRLVNLYRNGPIAYRTYGLDGDIRVLKYDVNGNGIIETGDKVILYFGMRRGGRYYYALDVTDRLHPQLLWKDGPSVLPGVGETWSPPVITRVKVKNATQNSQSLVLLFGGGYDDGEENYSYVTDDSGHRIYMVDALTGTLLWYAGGPGGTGTPNLLLDTTKTNGTMNNAIPGELTVLDTNGDRFADRIYTADLGGRIWRFDITNNETPSNLVAGGVIARLGVGDAPTSPAPTMADTRRFYSAPDVALIERRAADPYYNIAIGSGYRGHPKQSSATAGIGATSDRFYSIRDKSPFMPLKQSDYKSFTPAIDSDLVDITSSIATTVVPADKAGWKLDLRLNGVGSGEKVLGASTTANNVILFPTYQPANPTTADPCTPMGVNRAYALSVDNGRPALNFNDTDNVIDASDAFTRLKQGGIVDSINVAVIRADPQTPTDPNAPPPPPGGTNCLAGVEVLKKCVDVGGVVRTYWKRK